MTGAGRPLGWTEIESLLIEVGAELERRGLVRRVVVVGGAYAAYRGVRASTTDVDTIHELDDDLRAAVAVVAQRRGLEPDWLNDRARPWRPATLDPSTCETLLESGGIRVLVPEPDVVALMKISAGGRTPNDALDLRSLWHATRFATPDEAVSAFYDAYPHEERDPHLGEWIRAVVVDS